MNDLLVVHAGLDICWREDTDGVVRELGWRERALDVEQLLQLDGLLVGPAGDGLGLELVGDAGDGVVHRGREVAIQQNGEGELVSALLQWHGVWQENPLLEQGMLVGAVGAVHGEGLLLRDVDV